MLWSVVDGCLNVALRLLICVSVFDVLDMLNAKD